MEELRAQCENGRSGYAVGIGVLQQDVQESMRVRLSALWDRLRSSYWFVPALMAAASGCLALLCIAFDERYKYQVLRQQGWVYTGGPEGARAVLSTIAGAIITVAGTTFSITVAALSLASAQFGPRLLRNFMRDTGNQLVLGTFIATFLYCLLVLRIIRGIEDRVYVPHLSVTVGVGLATVSVAVLIYFIHHVAESIQVSHLIALVGRELDAAVLRLFPAMGSARSSQSRRTEEGGTDVLADAAGYIEAVDETALVRIGSEAKAVLVLHVRPGDYVQPRTRLATGVPKLESDSQNRVVGAFVLGRQRTTHQDAEFAFMQLAEIAVRALSPGVNDPFTAMMCIDRIAAGVAALGRRSLPAPELLDHAGAVRVIVRPYTYPELVRAAFGFIREHAEGFPSVRAHLQRKAKLALEAAEDPTLRNALLSFLEQT
jgi:uncharacterized membrane protein